VIRNKLGLHARPAALFVQTASQYKCEVQVTKDSETVDGKSIIEIMTLAAHEGSAIKILTRGSDAKAAMDGLTSLIESNFGE
jgi:phosphocarrier protein